MSAKKEIIQQYHQQNVRFNNEEVDILENENFTLDTEDEDLTSEILQQLKVLIASKNDLWQFVVKSVKGSWTQVTGDPTFQKFYNKAPEFHREYVTYWAAHEKSSWRTAIKVAGKKGPWKKNSKYVRAAILNCIYIDIDAIRNIPSLMQVPSFTAEDPTLTDNDVKNFCNDVIAWSDFAKEYGADVGYKQAFKIKKLATELLQVFQVPNLDGAKKVAKPMISKLLVMDTAQQELNQEQAEQFNIDLGVRKQHSSQRNSNVSVQAFNRLKDNIKDLEETNGLLQEEINNLKAEIKAIETNSAGRRRRVHEPKRNDDDVLWV